MHVIGQKLRAARQEQGLSLRALAKKADVSVGLLSQIENDKSTPSVRSLQAIADVLSVPLGYFFPNEDSPLKEWILRSADRPTLTLNDGILWKRLTPHEDKDAQFLELHYDVGSSSGAKMSYHHGREIGLVLCGELTVEIGFERHILHEGDSIIFDSMHPHRLINSGSVLMKAIWVVMNNCVEPTA